METTPWVIGPGLLLQRPSPFCWCAPPQLVQVAVVDFSGLSISRPLHLIHQMPPRTGVQGLPASQFHMHPLLHCHGVRWASGLARLAGVKLVVLVSTRGANVTSTCGPAWGLSSCLLCWIARGCHRFPVVALPPVGLAWGFGAGAVFFPTVS